MNAAKDRWMCAMPALSVTMCIGIAISEFCASATNPERRRWTKWSIISLYIQTTFIAFDVFVARVTLELVFFLFFLCFFCILFLQNKATDTDDGIMKNNSKNINTSMNVLVCSCVCMFNIKSCIVEKYCLLISLRMYCVTYAMHWLLWSSV